MVARAGRRDPTRESQARPRRARLTTRRPIPPARRASDRRIGTLRSCWAGWAGAGSTALRPPCAASGGAAFVVESVAAPLFAEKPEEAVDAIGVPAGPVSVPAPDGGVGAGSATASGLGGGTAATPGVAGATPTAGLVTAAPEAS